MKISLTPYDFPIQDLLSDWMNLDEPNSNMQSMDVSFDSVVGLSVV